MGVSPSVAMGFVGMAGIGAKWSLGLRMSGSGPASAIPHPERGDEGGLRDVDLAELAHPPLPAIGLRAISMAQSAA